MSSIDRQIINDPACCIEECAVERLTGLNETADIVGDQPLQERPAAGTFNIDDRHVGNIEHPDISTYRLMFDNLGAVMEWHVPATKRHHTCSRGNMGVIKRGASGHGGDSSRQSAGF